MTKKRKEEEATEEVKQEKKETKKTKKENKPKEKESKETVIFSEKVLTGISRLTTYKPLYGAKKVRITNLTGGDLLIGETVKLEDKLKRGESKTFEGTAYVKSASIFEILVEQLA